AERRVIGVKRVDPGVCREIGRQRQAEKAAVPLVVCLYGQIGEYIRGRVGEVVEDLDDPILLGDEDSPVRRKLDSCRLRQAAEDDLYLEARRQRGCRAGGASGEWQKDTGHQSGREQ